MLLKNLIKSFLLVGIAVVVYGCSSAAEDVEAVNKTVPQNVNAVASNSKVIINWEPVTNAEWYAVCWAYVAINECTEDNPNIVWWRSQDASVTQWIHDKITNDTEYHYVVVAFSSDWGISPVSINVSGTPKGIKPPPVVSVSSHDRRVTIGFTDTAQANDPNITYNLYMDTSPGVTPESVQNSATAMVHKDIPNPYQHIELTGIPNPIPTDKTVDDYKQYFVVTAVRKLKNGELIESAPSQEVIAVPQLADPYEAGYMPTDFKASSGNAIISGGNIVEEFELTWSNPCTTTNANQFTIFWSEQAFDPAVPYNCNPDIQDNCKTDNTSGSNNTTILNSLTKGTYYYFAIKTDYTSTCAGGSPQADPPPAATGLSASIAVKTPGTQIPVKPVISAVSDTNSITIIVDQPQDGLTYNLYMVGQKFIDAGNTLTLATYGDDIVWGMKHADIPTTFIHTALPSTLAFHFIVTSVNSMGNESPASDVVIATALAPIPSSP